MLRVIPKHKGTDHLQGDMKRRIKELVDEFERPRKGPGRGGPVLAIRPEGAAQIALIGPPNAGKSTLHARLTGSGANKADRLTDPEAELRAFLDVAGLRYPALPVSATTGHGLGEIGPWLFGRLGIARIYTKTPGRPADRKRPFVLRGGQTVGDGGSTRTQRPRALAQVRPRVGQVRIRWTARRARASTG